MSAARAASGFLSGGLILGGDLAADIDFGGAEGVIYANDLGPNKRLTWYVIMNLSGKVSGSNGVTVLGGPLPGGHDWAVPGHVGVDFSNRQNDFRGPITSTASACTSFRTRSKTATFVAGSLGNMTNDIVLNGGFLCPGYDDDHSHYCIAPSRTIYFGLAGGCSGGYAPVTKTECALLDTRQDQRTRPPEPESRTRGEHYCHQRQERLFRRHLSDLRQDAGVGDRETGHRSGAGVEVLRPRRSWATRISTPAHG